MGTCSVDGCARPARARGWCLTHWKRWRRNGDPSASAVRQRRPPEERFWEKVDRSDGPSACWNWQASRDELGYGFFRLIPGKNMWKAHRVAWVLTHGEVPDGKLVRHDCDNPSCVNPAHMRLGTDLENSADKVARRRTTLGRTVHHGEGSGRSAKLTLADVREIKRLYAEGAGSQAAIGAMFGVTQTQVGRIVRGERWAHDT